MLKTLTFSDEIGTVLFRGSCTKVSLASGADSSARDGAKFGVRKGISGEEEINRAKKKMRKFGLDRW